VRNADGDARALGDATARWTTPQKGALLHVSGEQGSGILAQTLTAHGFNLRKAVLYRVDAATALPPEVQSALMQGTVDAALFFSPRSARTFAGLAASLSVHGMIAACISVTTAEALAPLHFADIRIAAHPNQAALLARLSF
jgi:uroporphyrinogen-III synthase